MEEQGTTNPDGGVDLCVQASLRSFTHSIVHSFILFSLSFFHSIIHSFFHSYMLTTTRSLHTYLPICIHSHPHKSRESLCIRCANIHTWTFAWTPWRAMMRTFGWRLGVQRRGWHRIEIALRGFLFPSVFTSKIDVAPTRRTRRRLPQTRKHMQILYS